MQLLNTQLFEDLLNMLQRRIAAFNVLNILFVAVLVGTSRVVLIQIMMVEIAEIILNGQGLQAHIIRLASAACDVIKGYGVCRTAGQYTSMETCVNS